MTLSDFMHHLDGVRHVGKQIIARCPAHDDKHQSLAVCEADDGKILLCCYAGCATQNILESLGLGWSAIMGEKQAINTAQVVATYDYTDETGALIFQVVRYYPKSFRQRRPDGNGGWIYDLKGCRRVLYRLPEVLSAVKEGKPIWICEGEKDAETLRSIGFCATSKSCGASGWSSEYSKIFREAKVLLVPDNDVAGVRFMREVASSLLAQKARVKMIRLEVAPGGDITDWISAGHTAKDLMALARATPVLSFAKNNDDHLRNKIKETLLVSLDMLTDPFIEDDDLCKKILLHVHEVLCYTPSVGGKADD